MKEFPFISLAHALIVARFATAIFFMAHAIMRIAKGTIPQFGGFMETVGFPNGVVVVWLITLVEIVSGLLLMSNRYVRVGVAGLFSIALGGIILIHFKLGWFVGEFGTGGSEYSVALMVLLLIVASADREAARKAAPD